jgi:hypothetical protein
MQLEPPWLTWRRPAGDLQERICDKCALAAQRRTVQGQRLHVWGLPVHACPRQRRSFQPGLLVPVTE